MLENSEKKSERRAYDEIVKTTKFPDGEPNVPDFYEHRVKAHVEEEIQQVY